MSEMSVQHRAWRWFGGVIFLIGLGMMATVFALAVIAFLRVPEALMGGGGASGEGVTRPLAAAGVQIGFLFVMAYLSSLFASKGLELFSIARTRAEE
ncbi:MAG: hypothetical protein MUQ65_13885 [Armatimonadetes bacterium]|nr:hypothetical protein [Armatimonadota bacterium]